MLNVEWRSWDSDREGYPREGLWKRGLVVGIEEEISDEDRRASDDNSK